VYETSAIHGLSLSRLLVSAAAAPAAATAAAVVALLLVLQEILSNTTEKCTSDRSQESVSGLLAKEVAAESTASSAEKTTIRLGHWWGIGIVVWSVGL